MQLERRGPEPVVLASSSPRRRRLLREAGIPHEVVPPLVSEALRAGENPEEHALRCAWAKARAVASQWPGRLVLAADTAVCVEGEILPKPETEQRLTEMLRRLSGRRHRVLTAVVLLRYTPRFEAQKLVVSHVTFRPLTADQIAWYVGTGEGLDKAGGYAIQGKAGRLIASYDGSFTNIVGLPLEAVSELLAEAQHT